MLKNKKLLFFASVLLFAFILFINISSFAVEFEKDGTTYTYPDFPFNDDRPFILVKQGNTDFLLVPTLSLTDVMDYYNLENTSTRTYTYYFTYEISLPTRSSDNFFVSFGYIENGEFTSLYCNQNLAGQASVSRYDLNNERTSWNLSGSNNFVGIRVNEYSISFANKDILDGRPPTSLNNVFFQGTPLPTMEVETILAPVMEEVEMAPVMSQIIGLLPYLIACLVGFLGLRKGLRLLVRTLRGSLV